MKQELQPHHFRHIAQQLRGIRVGLESYTVSRSRKIRYVLALSFLEKCAREFDDLAKIADDANARR